MSEFEKAMLVEKLKGARERKRRETGKKVGGRKNYAEIEGGPEMLPSRKSCIVMRSTPASGRQVFRTAREVRPVMRTPLTRETG